MIIRAPKLIISFVFTFGVLTLSACTTAKLEARLEANPQCKEVINAKTGALMPCPGTDRAFYRSAGLEPAKVSATNPSQSEPSFGSSLTSMNNTSAAANSGKSKTSPASIPQDASKTKNDCKPTIHNKSGGLMPCLPPD